jgi:hypothetical protein
MNRFSKKLFDETVSPDEPAYTSIDDAPFLASGRQMAIAAVCGAASLDARITVDIIMSSDGRRYVSKYVTPIIDDVPLSSTPKTVYAGESTARPNMQYVLLKVTVTGVATKVALHVSVRGSDQTSDDEGEDEDEDEVSDAVVRVPAPLGSPRRTEEATAELHALADASRGMNPAERAAYVLQGMSRETRDQIRELDRRILAIPPEARQKLVDATVRMMRTALEVAGSGLRAQRVKDACCPTAAPAAPKAECEGGCAAGVKV